MLEVNFDTYYIKYKITKAGNKKIKKQNFQYIFKYIFH